MAIKHIPTSPPKISRCHRVGMPGHVGCTDVDSIPPETTLKCSFFQQSNTYVWTFLFSRSAALSLIKRSVLGVNSAELLDLEGQFWAELPLK